VNFLFWIGKKGKREALALLKVNCRRGEKKKRVRQSDLSTLTALDESRGEKGGGRGTDLEYWTKGGVRHRPAIKDCRRRQNQREKKGKGKSKKTINADLI